MLLKLPVGVLFDMMYKSQLIVSLLNGEDISGIEVLEYALSQEMLDQDSKWPMGHLQLLLEWQEGT